MRQLVILRRTSAGPGGAERVAERFASLFDSGDWQVALWHAGKELAAGSRLAGVRGPNWWQALAYARSADRAVARWHPDLVLGLERGPRCDVFRAGDGVHTRWLQLSGKPFLSRFLNPFHTVAPWMELRSMRSARLIVPNSHMVAAEITNRDPALRDRTRVIHNGFDGTRFHPLDGSRQELRRKLALPGAGQLLLFAGSGWERKGLALALVILASVSPHASLCVLGKGKPESYATQIHRLGLQRRVFFHGVRENIAEYYQAADVFVLPTLYDPFSNACLESLACGTPVITTRTNGAAEVIVEGRTGCLMDVRQPDLRKVKLFLEHLPDDPAATANSVSLKEQRFELEAYHQVFLEALRLKQPR